MKATIAGLSNERLEQEIAHVYVRAAGIRPGVLLREEGLLGLLWAEFDERFVSGVIGRDSDWLPDDVDDF